MQTREEIQLLVARQVDAVVDWFGDCSDEEFVSGPEGRWTAGQHMDHLLRSAKPLNMALRLPKIVLRVRFGKARAASRSLDELATRYEDVLTAGGKAPGRFVPPDVPLESKMAPMIALPTEVDELLQAFGKWSEADLDHYVLPHPLLGNLTVREMLFFTYHHMGHHLETLKRDYTKEER